MRRRHHLVSTWSGWVYVAFVTDAYTRRITGWRVGTTMTTQLVLDALEQAIWTRYTERLAEASIAASVGSVGDSYDCETGACRLAA